MSRDVYKWHHLAILKNMWCSWQRGKQNSIVEWSEVKQGEYGDTEQDRVAKCQILHRL